MMNYWRNHTRNDSFKKTILNKGEREKAIKRKKQAEAENN